ncbi:hypothetical protein DSO57_1018060 [Entomophthora muscae]|uniref:Uncharacterized protein n=1 Tax=Entomophthora muscae TaxID=34485 RepID=A0ACC2RJ24_9FUNG|nr:hypothetical protein DSO57_1018060 [Entomophthora muscae]
MAPSMSQGAFLGNVNKFLATYKGPGSVTRLTGAKRSVSSEQSDWDEDIQVPLSGFPSRPRTFSELDDLESFLSGEQDPVPSRASTTSNLSRFSSLKSVQEENSPENDFHLPAGELELQLSPPPDDPTLEINFDEELDQGMTSDSVRSTISKGNISPYTRESSTEAWDDIIIPSDVSKLKVASRKPYRPTGTSEENWCEDIEIPSDDVFSSKVAAKRFQTRKHARNSSRHLQRNTIKFEVNLSRMRESYCYAPRTYGTKDLRHKASEGSFHYRQELASRSLVSFFPTPGPDVKMTTSDPATPEYKPFYRPKLRLYGDGTELDNFDNLPVPISPKSRHKSNKMQRINPPSKSEAPAERYSQLLSQFSEIEVEKQGFASSSKAKPHLIQNLNSLKVERVVGDMKFNPQTLNWEGNDHALKDFDAVSPPRPALITNLNSNKRPRRVGDMIFDPEQMRWFAVGAEEDPFANIPDLTTSDPPVVRNRPGVAPGDSFYLSAKTIDALYAAERQHRQFMSAWSEASQSMDGRGIGHEHLFDIRDFPANF